MFPALCNRARSLRHHRSHKDLRGQDTRNFHARQASNATNSSWASGPSTDSGRPSTSKETTASSSSEWNPLRLHPALDTARSPHILRGQQSATHYHIDDDASHRPQPPRSFRELQASHSDVRLEIDDGFDFGFTTALRHPPVHHLTPPTPPAIPTTSSRPRTAGSSASSSDDKPPSSWASPALSSSSGSSDWDPPDTPTSSRSLGRRHDGAATPRHPGNFSTLTTDYFITRGDWKRRGIVFAAEEARGPSEEECFEIP